MTTVRLILLFLHLIGMASVVGAYLTQMSATSKRIVTAFVHGAWTQLVTGILLVGVREMLHSDDAQEWSVDHVKWGVKLLVTAVVLVLVMANRRKDAIPMGLFHAIGLLAVANVAIAVFW